MPRIVRAALSRVRGLVRLFVLDLPKFISCRLRGESGLWWTHKFNQLIRNSRVLYNVNRARKRDKPMRALLAYTVSPFLGDRPPAWHTNQWRSIELVRMLDELGYVVDVMDHNDFRSPIKHDYDLLIGFGRAEELAKHLPREVVKIRLATGSEANFHNQRERERIEEVNQRRGCNLEVVRRNPDQSELIRYFDAIACLGNAVTAATYRPYFDKEIYCFNNHGYDQWMGLPEGKDFEEARRNFLFFGGRGQVLLGLDLLLEVFANRPDLNLFVCGPFEREKEFVKCYRKELFETPNIFPVGWVSVAGEDYLELVKRCSTVIVPICSGASTGGVVVCMGYGLIPVVTREAGIDTDDFGITLPSYKMADIEKAVDWISTQPADWHEETARKVLSATRQDFSQAAFSRQFREILCTVLEKHASQPPRPLNKNVQ